MPYQDPESNLHVVEVKIRLKPVDGALAHAIADKRDTKTAILCREIVVRGLQEIASSLFVDFAESTDTCRDRGRV